MNAQKPTRKPIKRPEKISWSARRGPVIGLWLFILALSFAVILHTRFTADMSAFMPEHPTAAQAFLVDQIKDGAISRMILIGIEGGDAAARDNASRALAKALRQSGLFSLVRNGDAPDRSRDKAVLFDYRYLLSPNTTAQHFTEAGLHEALTNGIDLLASPFGLFSQKIFTRDPTAETFAILNQLGQDHAPRSQNGVWVSPNGKRALIMLLTRAPGADTDAMEQALNAIHSDFARLTKTQPTGSSLKLLVSGAPVFSVDARALIKTDVHRFSIIGSLAVMLLLFLAYRSVSMLILGLLPVLTGIAVAIAVVSLGFGFVHGVTIGFGTTLIGEAIDYSIYYFIQTQQNSADDANTELQQDNPAGMDRFWPTIRLGVLTSITGFAALLFSGFPGLAQIGLYSIAGLTTAALVTRFVLPHLGTARFNRHSLAGLGLRLAPVFRGLRSLRWVFVLLAVIGLVLLLWRHNDIWQTGLSGLNPISAQAKAVDATLRRDMGADDARYFIVVPAPTQQAALSAAERLDAALVALVKQGVIARFDSPAQFLPSVATQRARQQALPDRATLSKRLAAAVVGLPIRASTLEPFIDAVEQARRQTPLTPADLKGTSLGVAIDALLQPVPSGSIQPHGQTHSKAQWQALIRLYAPSANGTIDTTHITEAIRASGIDNALLADKDAEASRLFNGYLENTITLSLAGLLGIVLLLALVLRRPARLLRVLLPLVIAVVLVMAGLNLAGEQLNILNLVGLLLIVAIGSNYALFFNQNKAPDPQTLASLALANLTTVIAFGTLAFSQLPILHAFGSTVAPGALLALLVAAAFAKPDKQPKDESCLH